MSGIETIIKCPNCGKVALGKYESCIGAGLSFDACPHCMYLSSDLPMHSPIEQRPMIWQHILNHHSASLIELRENLAQIEDTEYLDPHGFMYSDKDSQQLTKLGGDQLFYTDRVYRAMYHNEHKSVRGHNKEQQNELVDAIEFAGKESDRVFAGLASRDGTRLDDWSDTIPF